MINHLLIIDDDATACSLVKLQCNRCGFAKKVTSLSNGQQGLEYFQQLQLVGNDSVPDLIFLDIYMPVIDGWEFLDEYHRRYQPQFPTTKIFVVTCSVNPLDARKAATYSFISNYHEKPLLTKDFRELKNHQDLSLYFSSVSTD